MRFNVSSEQLYLGRTGNIVRLALVLGMLISLSGCGLLATKYEGDPADLVPSGEEVGDEYALLGDNGSFCSSMDAIKPSIGCLERNYGHTTLDYRGLTFRVLTYDDEDAAGVMYFVFREILLDPEGDSPTYTEDEEWGAISSADTSAVFYFTESGASDTFVQVWLLAQKANVVVFSGSQGVTTDSSPGVFLEELVEQSRSYVESIVDKID